MVGSVAVVISQPLVCLLPSQSAVPPLQLPVQAPRPVSGHHLAPRHPVWQLPGRPAGFQRILSAVSWQKCRTTVPAALALLPAMAMVQGAMAQGARLKRRVSAGAIVVVVFVVILWFSGVFQDAFHFFSR